MALLDLPPELFDHVIRYAVEHYGPVQAVKLRLVCKTFASHIRADILRGREILDTKYVERPGLLERLTHTYGADLLQARVVEKSDPLSGFVRDVVNKLVGEAQSSPKDLRDTYRYRICQAVCEAIGWVSLREYLRTGQLGDKGNAEDIEPMRNSKMRRSLVQSAAAAVGNLEYLQRLTKDPQGLIEIRPQCLPSALESAVVTRNVEVAKWILNHPGLESLRNSSDPHVTSSYVCNLRCALNIAIRTSQNELGLLIVESCLYVLSIRGFDSWSYGWSDIWIDDAIRSASEYGNGEFFLKLLACRHRSKALYHQLVIENGLGISSDCLFEGMSRSTALHILQKRAMDPIQYGRYPTGLRSMRAIDLNKFGNHVPMHLAIDRGRFDIATLLLEQGADIDARDYGGFGQNALEHAISKSHPCLASVQFLIENDSDPRIILDRQDAKTAGLRSLIRTIIESPSDNVLEVLTRDNWRALWQSEREGLLKDSWQTYERMTATLDDIPYVEDCEGTT